METDAMKSAEFEASARNMGIGAGDTLIVHSSFKSMGPLENGADMVVTALLNVLGNDGTLVFPTLCQKDWAHVYENYRQSSA